MTLFYPNLSQITYFGVGDVDECSIIAAFWAARQAGFSGRLPTVKEFRAAAGVPDRPGATGLTTAQVWQGVKRTGLSAGATVLSWGTSWQDFAGQMKSGGAASVALSSAALPAGYRYGFQGAHSVALTWDKGQWYIANPLAPEGSGPQVISEAAIRKAVLAFGSYGVVQGVVFKPVAGASGAAAVASAPVKPAEVPRVPPAAMFQAIVTSARDALYFYQARHPVEDTGRRG